MYRNLPKRLFDVGGALIALVILGPVICVTALAVWMRLGRPVLFRQSRPGRHAEPFTILKFRTMRISAGEQDAERLTSFGRVLRACSLDELPELFNVIAGDMSLVGPRPLLAQYVNRYTQEQARRHELKPGITGWAQVNGRNALTWEDKFRHDVWYVDNCSLALDLRILGLTVWRVLARRGINQPGHATAQEFMGSEGSRP